MTRILHVADPHVDSPLKGLSRYPGLPVDLIREATRRAFENAVAYALRNQIDLMLIAGDLFDGTWRDMGTGLWVVDQFLKLREGGIPVGLIRGNHDALSKVAPQLTWPDNVHEFSAARPESWTLEQLGLVIHGQSFADPKEPNDLAAQYPNAIPDLFNVGLLHTSLAGSPDTEERDRYAPTTTDVLATRGYDYWALGHIHLRSSIETEHGTIAYAGNLQGRHVRETGPKGAVVVDVQNGHARTQFEPFDVVRWHRADVVVHEDDSIDDMLADIELHLADCRRQSDDRPAIVRVELTGTAGCHDELTGLGRVDELTTQVRRIAQEQADVWVEQVRVRTRPPVDVQALVEGDELLAMLLGEFEAIRTQPSALEDLGLVRGLEPLTKLAARKAVSLDECGLELANADEQRRWLAEAESTLLATLTGMDESGGEV